jgi:hypothetical protein
MLGHIFLNRDVTKRGRSLYDLRPAGPRQCVVIEERARDILRYATEMRGGSDSGEMNIDRVGHRPRIASCHRHRNRQTSRTAQIQDHKIPRAQSFLGLREPTEPIVAIRIGAGEIGREFRLRRRECMPNAPFQCIEIVAATGPIRQFDVEIARFLAKWKIPGAVNRTRERGRIIGKNRLGAVAPMHIAIQDCHAPARFTPMP